MLSDAEYTKEEASSGHEGESLLSDLSESSEDEDEYYDRTGAKDNNYDVEGGGDCRGDRNTGSRGGSAEWLRFLSLSALTETLGAMAKAKSSSSTASRKKGKGRPEARE